MPIKIYNTAIKNKEFLEPRTDNVINMYVCGITAYDRSHIGHARSAVVFDVIVKYMRKTGLKVNFLRNFTDIDDKIINRAIKENISAKELAEREIRHFYEDMEALGVLRADIEPKATEHIPEMITLISMLIEKGHAYATPIGDVYFAVRSLPSYGSLSNRTLDELMAGARVDVDEHKKDPMDFALWKSAKPGEPFWQSPWGDGRPGWHIECSAMSMKYVGETLDIHGGGLDLIFPHHENEKAQSEAATGKPYVKCWMHNGFVTINGEKMSKSLGNFITIQEILKAYHPETLRLLLLSKHYRSPLDYSDDGMKQWQSALDRAYQALDDALGSLKRPVSKAKPVSVEAQEAINFLERLEQEFCAAMDDDFNTAQAIGVLFEGIRMLNRLTQEAEKKPSTLYLTPIKVATETIRGLSSVLGILQQEPAFYIRGKNLKALAAIGMEEADVEMFIQKRSEARKAKNWADADAIRKELEEKGVFLKDTSDGTIWYM